MKTLCLFLIAFFSSFSWAALDPSASYSCQVVDSNDSNIPVGTVTAGPLTVASLKTGFIGLKGSGPSHMIDFYGPLTAFNLMNMNSGLQAFASPPTEPREIHGSIVVSDGQNGGVNLAVKLFPTTRAFNDQGTQAFIFADEPLAYKFSCTKN